jgi:hypothetical protein
VVVAGLLVANLLVDIVAAFSDLAELDLLNRIAARQPFTIAEANASDTRQGVIGIAQTLLAIGTGVAFIIWLHRAYSNLPTLGVPDLRYRRWWAIGGWFIPIWWSFRPKQLVNDVWRGSDPSLPEWAGGLWHQRPVPAWWIVWWLAFVMSNQIGSRVFVLAFGAETLPELQTVSRLYLATDILDALAAILAVFVVRSASARQLERARSLGVDARTADKRGGPATAPGR